MLKKNQTMKPKLRPLAVNRNCLTRSEYTELLSTPKGYTWKGRRDLIFIMKRCKKMPQNDRLRPKNSTHTMLQHFVQTFLQGAGDSLTSVKKMILEKTLNSKIHFSDQEWSNFPNTQIELCTFLRNLNPDCSSSKWKQDFLKTLSSLIFNYIVQVQCNNRLSKNRKLARLILMKINNITQVHLLPNSTDDFLQEVQIFIAHMLSPWLNKPLTDSCQYANNDIQIDKRKIKRKIGESKSKLNGSLNGEMKNAKKIKKIKKIKKSKDNENTSNNSIERLVANDKPKNDKKKSRIAKNDENSTRNESQKIKKKIKTLPQNDNELIPKDNENTSNNSIERLVANDKPKNDKKKSRIAKNDENSTRNESQKIKKKIKTLPKNDNELISTNVNSTADLSKRKSIIAETNSRAVNDNQNEAISPKEENIEKQITDQRQNTDIIISRDTLQDNLNDKSNNETTNVSNVSGANKESDEGVTVKSDFSSRKSIISNHNNTPSTETDDRTEYEKRNEVISSNAEEINNLSNHDKHDQKMVIDTNFSNQNSKIKTPNTESKEKDMKNCPYFQVKEFDNCVSSLISFDDAFNHTVLCEIKPCVSKIMGFTNYGSDRRRATKSMRGESDKSSHGYEKVCYQRFVKNISKTSETRNEVCSKCNKNPGIMFHLLKREDSNYSVHKTILPISENEDPALDANTSEMAKSKSLKSKVNKCNCVYYCQNKWT